MASLNLQADFNGLFSALLCRSHKDTALDQHGNVVKLAEGMQVTVFEENDEDNKRDDLIASGMVERCLDSNSMPRFALGSADQWKWSQARIRASKHFGRLRLLK